MNCPHRKFQELACIDENIFSKSLAKALASIFLFVAPISIKADAIDSYSSVAIDAKNTSIAAHVFGDIRPTIPVIHIYLCHSKNQFMYKIPNVMEVKISS